MSTLQEEEPTVHEEDHEVILALSARQLSMSRKYSPAAILLAVTNNKLNCAWNRMPLTTRAATLFPPRRSASGAARRTRRPLGARFPPVSWMVVRMMVKKFFS